MIPTCGLEYFEANLKPWQNFEHIYHGWLAEITAENLALHAPEIALIYSVLWQICIVCPLIVRDPRFNKSHVTSLLIQ